MTESSLFLLGNIICYSGFIAIVLFTVFYGVRSPWRSTIAGKALLTQSVSFMAVILLTAVTLLLGPDFPAREFVRIGIYAFFSASTWALFITLLKVQNKKTPRVDLPKTAILAPNEESQSVSE